MTTPSKRTGLRAWLDFRPGHHRPKRVLQGAISSTLFLAFIYVLFFKPPLLPSGDKTVRALFRDAPQLRVNQATPVRVKGIEVGKVKKFDRGPGGRGVLVEMSIKKDAGVDVKRDARMTLLYRTLLGRNMYVDLEPGSRAAPALGDQVLPVSRTTGPVELDQLLYPLDPRGRRSVKDILQETRRGFSDPKGPQASLRRIGPALDDLGRGLRGLQGTRPGDLRAAVRATSRAMAGLARDEAALGGLINDGRVALGVTAARSADLQATVTQAPAAMADVRTTADRLETTLDTLDPLARELRPGARKLSEAAGAAQTALASARTLLSEARPMLRDLRPAVSRLSRAAGEGVPVLRGLNPSLGRVGSDFVPWLDQRDPELKIKNFSMIGPTVSAAAGAFSHYDANGQSIVFQPGVGTNVIQPTNLPCRVRVTNPVEPEKRVCEGEALAGLVGALLGESPRRLRSLPATGAARLGVPFRPAALKGGSR